MTKNNRIFLILNPEDMTLEQCRRYIRKANAHIHYLKAVKDVGDNLIQEQQATIKYYQRKQP